MVSAHGHDSAEPPNPHAGEAPGRQVLVSVHAGQWGAAARAHHAHRRRTPPPGRGPGLPVRCDTRGGRVPRPGARQGQGRRRTGLARNLVVAACGLAFASVRTTVSVDRGSDRSHTQLAPGKSRFLGGDGVKKYVTARDPLLWTASPYRRSLTPPGEQLWTQQACQHYHAGLGVGSAQHGDVVT